MPGHWAGESPHIEGGKGGAPTPLFYFCTSTLANFEIPIQGSSIHTDIQYVLSQLYSVAQETL